MTTLTTTSPRTAVRTRRVLTGAAVGAVAGAAVSSVFGAAAGWAGIPMEAGSFGAAQAQPISPANFAIGVLVCSFWGTVLAMVLNRFAHHPRTTFVRVALGLVTLSLAAPGLATDTPVSTKIMLAAAHLVAAAVVVPSMARSLPAERP